MINGTVYVIEDGKPVKVGDAVEWHVTFTQAEDVYRGRQ